MPAIVSVLRSRDCFKEFGLQDVEPGGKSKRTQACSEPGFKGTAMTDCGYARRTTLNSKSPRAEPRRGKPPYAVALKTMTQAH